MTMTQLFFFTEESLVQDIVQFSLSNTSMPGESSSSLLFGCTCRSSCLLCQGTWDGGAVLGRNWLPLPLYFLSLCSVRWKEDRESSVSHILSAVMPVSGKAGCDSSGLSLYYSQILVNLLTSSQGSCTK